jgi:hypothetical protein
LIDLSPREFRLLEHFMLHPDEVVTRVQLLRAPMARPVCRWRSFPSRRPTSWRLPGP